MREGKGIQGEKFSVKYSSPQRHRSSCAPGHNKLCTVASVTGHNEIYQHHSSAHATFFSSIQCCHIPENQLQIILTLTYAYRDICRPLIVVLAGDRFFSNQLKPKLAFKSQDSSIWKVVTFSYSIERSSRVSTTLFVYFWNDTDSKEDMNSSMVPKDGYKQSMLTGILT